MLRSNDRDRDRTRRANAGFAGNFSDNRKDRVKYIARTGHQSENKSDDGGNECDGLRAGTQQFLCDPHKKSHTAGGLECGSSKNHAHHDEHDGNRGTGRSQSEDEDQRQQTYAAAHTKKDTAESCPQYHRQNDDEKFVEKHNRVLLVCFSRGRSMACRRPAPVTVKRLPLLRRRPISYWRWSVVPDAQRELLHLL